MTEKSIRIGKSEFKVLQALYKIDDYTTSKYVAEKSKIPKNQTDKILKSLKKKRLVKSKKQEWNLTKKGFKKFIELFNSLGKESTKTN